MRKVKRITSSRFRARFAAITVIVLCVVQACTSKAAADKSNPPTAVSAPIAVVRTGLASSEAVVFDPARDVYFVSNMNGDPGLKDGTDSSPASALTASSIVFTSFRAVGTE